MRKLGGLFLAITFVLSSAAAVEAQADPPSYDDTINRVDLHQGHADVLRLYRAYFARQPDAGGASYWVEAYNSCEWGTARISQFFSESPEFMNTYGTIVDEEFISEIYQNVFGRLPDADGAAYWLAQLQSGKTRGAVVADFSFSDEFRADHPLPSDGTPNTGCTGQKGLDFFRSTQPICEAWSDQVGNPRPAAARFSDAVVSAVHDDSKVIIIDGLGDTLIVDFALALDDASRNGSTEPVVVYSVDGPTGVLPAVYSFGCPHTLYLGSASD